ncbi:MAG: response regulator [Desulfobacterales bacterium]|nr:response regulator [Desulfobacterales bacterium]
MPTTILLVDDHAVFRKGLRLLFEAEQDFKVVGEAGDGQEAIDRVRVLSPDVVIMDINMPNFNGIDATRQIVSDFPETKIVTLSIHSGKRFIEDMLSAGAAGYILKECAPEELVKGVRAVMRNEIYLSPSVTGIVISEFVKPKAGGQVSKDDNGWTAVETTPIIHTKLHRPQIPKNHVHRSRLLEQLEKGRQKQFTLVSAPAGYGKSILLSCWLENCDCPNAWYSVDESDNSLRQFLIYFLTAIRTMFPDAVEKTVVLANTGNLPPMKVLLANLINEMNLIDQDYILAVDDIQLIQEKQVYDLLTELLRYPPQRMHLVLIGRRDPFLPISSLRAQGLMTEIRLQDLCFTKAETKAYLDQVIGDQIEDAIAAKWTKKTEGWIVGLHLAALSMRQRGDATSMLTEIPGGLQYVTEYLFNEVFKSQSPEIRHFLLSTAILDRFCAPLCEVLVGPDAESRQDDINSWDFLDVLKNQNLFIVGLDPKNRWFRYHHLFQQLLKDQLMLHRSSEEIVALHSRAGNWFAENNLIDEAIRHLLAAGDVIGAAQLVEENRQTMLDSDRWYVFEKWLSMLPDTVIQQRPILLLAHVWILYHQFDIPAIPSIIDAVEAHLKDDPMEQHLRGEIEFFRGYICYFQNKGSHSLKHLQEALKLVPEKYHEIRGQIEILYGLARQMQGQKEDAVKTLTDLLYHKEPPFSVRKTRLLVTLVYIHIISGDLDSAFVINQQLFDFATKNNYIYAKVWSVYLKGLIHFYRNELDKAIDHFGQAIEEKFIFHTRAVVDSMAGLIFSYQAEGQPDQAGETIQKLLKYVASQSDPTYLMIADSCNVRLSIMQGELVSAMGWLQESSPPVENMVWWLEIPAVTRCRALLAKGSHESLEKAEIKLRELLQLNQDNHNTCHTIHILPLLVMVYHKQGRDDEALTILEEAVDLAKPGGWIRPFVELGSPMADLLNQLLRQNVAVDYIEKLLAAFSDQQTGPPSLPLSPSPHPPVSPSTRPQPLVEPLTNRELDILDLLAQRLQNKEIADKLFISPETVKTHLNNIYQKLNVTNRRHAVERAKTLGIL